MAFAMAALAAKALMLYLAGFKCLRAFRLFIRYVQIFCEHIPHAPLDDSACSMNSRFDDRLLCSKFCRTKVLAQMAAAAASLKSFRLWFTPFTPWDVLQRPVKPIANITTSSMG